MLLTYFLNDFEIVPIAPIITVITLVFTFHMRCIYYYYYIYCCSWYDPEIKFMSHVYKIRNICMIRHTSIHHNTVR
jgi:hypothetical protein